MTERKDEKIEKTTERKESGDEDWRSSNIPCMSKSAT